MILKNYWYVAAEPHEIGRLPFARTICNEPIVFWRTEDGTPVAFEDRCCHRRMPLSKGAVEGDTLRCHYHGLRFDTTGRCIRIPGQSTIPPGAAVRSYPIRERYNWVWIWIGDPALADDARIVPYPWRTSAEWGDKGTYMHVKSDYRLIVDNLLDLSHLAFVHLSTIGTSAVAEAARIRTFRTPDSVTVARWIVGTTPAPTHQKATGWGPDTIIDRWQIIEWRPPGFVRLSVGGAPGAAEGKEFGFIDLDRPTPAGGFGQRNLNALTPETETTTHYFWSHATDTKPITPERTDAVFRQIVTAFHQDWEVFERQQANWDDRPTIDTVQDAGSIAARQIIAAISAEQCGARAVAAE
jgi:phenylpropionate dioxygenase-like ring-hydroxylating dioxygenase large terminal subunit